MKLLKGADARCSLLSNGCIIAGRVENSVLSPGVIVEAGAEVRNSILMNDTVIGKRLGVIDVTVAGITG